VVSVIINEENSEHTLRNDGDHAKEEEKERWLSLDWVIKSRWIPVCE